MNSNKNELISVIVPVYQVEKYLERCVDSILKQTYTNIEVILVDDGSKDNSPAICDEYLEKDSRIKVIHKKNGGLSSARNAGIEKAEGDWLMFIDSDDCISLQMIERMYSICNDNGNGGTDIVICGYKRFSDIEEINEHELKKNTQMEVLDSDEAISRIYSRGINYVVAWNKIYRRKLFDNIRYKEGKLNEDEFTTYKLFGNANRIIEIHEELYFYFYNGNSITTNQKYIISNDLFEAFDECIEYYEKYNYLKSLSLIKKAYLDRIISRCKMALNLDPPKYEYCNELVLFYRKKYKELSKDVSGIGYRLFFFSYKVYFLILKILKKY